VSIHDLVWRRHPELLRPTTRRRLAWLTPITLRRVERVFVLTKTVRQDLIEAYGFPASRIDVVAPGVDPLFRPVKDSAELDSVRKEYDLPQDFILYIGALQPRKNLVRLAQAFSRLAARGLPHSLVIAGPRIWLYEGVLRQLDSLRLGNRLKFIGYVVREDIPLLMSAASAFAYVSIYEGFGLPVLEAMQCGCPVVASSATSVPEVAGDAAILVDPYDVGALADGIRQALADTAVREKLIAAGFRQAAAFSWRRCADTMLRTIRETVAHS